MVVTIGGCGASSDSAEGTDTEPMIHFESDALGLGTLVAFYPFWESAEDTSGHQNHGVAHSATYVTDRFGSGRSAVSLDGEETYLVLAQQVIGTDLGAFTMSLWFRTTQTSNGTLFFEGIKGGKGLWVKLQPGKGRIRARAKSAFTVDAEGTYNDGRWHHLVLRAEASTAVTIFIDGALAGDASFEEDYDGVEFLPVTPVLGRAGEEGAEEPSDYFAGTLDDIAFLRGALTDTEVQTLFYDGPNRVPGAVIDGDRTLFVPDVTFDASNSWDDDGVVVLWEWNFGDGTGSTQGPIVTHSFPDYGTYEITVTVTDDEGGKDVATTGLVLRDPACPHLECSEDDLWSAPWIAFELSVLEETNKHRAAGAECDGVPMAPVPALEMNEICRAAARLHAMDMGKQAYFSHDGLDGSSPSERMKRAGFEGPGPMGENIAAGQTSPEKVVQGWMESPGHCMNIMDPEYQVLGAGYASVVGSPHTHYWVQTFAGGH